MTFCAAVSEGGVPAQSVSRAGQGPFLQTRGKSDIMESTTRKGALSVKEIIRAGPKKGAQNQPRPPRSFQGTSEKEEKFKQNQVQ